ncbi:MAG: hypothetical protein AAFZ38_10645 [Myxococcota bacterium]
MSIQLGVVSSAAVEALLNGDPTVPVRLVEAVGSLTNSRRSIHPELESAIMSDLLEPFELLDDGMPVSVEEALADWLAELLQRYRNGGPW